MGTGGKAPKGSQIIKGFFPGKHTFLVEKREQDLNRFLENLPGTGHAGTVPFPHPPSDP